MTPNKHVAPAVHALHGVLPEPEAEKVVPATHGANLHTVSVVWVQAVLTPAAHVESAVHTAHVASIVLVPRLETYSVAASQVFQGLQQLASSLPEEVNLPAPHAAQVPALPVAVVEPAV